ncbi:UPF0223 family protein [Salimicrobium sp. PL1-032A]|uniref:UPF0223 family protein n=1 Tax=Salimicrobium sp. PL1-032A TaxID=3095364 RepID=UPI003260A08A
MDYSYPIDEEYWSKEEIIDVVNFYSLVEKAYENGAKTKDLMLAYERFKQVVPSKSEEKQLFKKFEQSSGYSAYHAVKQAKSSSGTHVNM